jgi:TetR/AcrR family transcriptional regulator, tetracycline repressor protein
LIQYNLAMPRSGRSRSLTQSEIVQAALLILRRDGLGGLTMRAVASELGVTPMAVYHYVEDKDHLLRLAYADISSAWGPLRLAGGSWEEALRAHLISIWEGLARYPGLGAYLIERPNINVTPESLAQGIQFFEDAGFPPVEARLAWSYALTYIHGRISVDAHLAHRPEAPRLEGLRAHDYVSFGVDAVIAGLEAMRKKNAPARAKARARA